MSAIAIRNGQGTCRVCQITKDLDKLKRCSQCRTAIYCGAECQRKDWKTHKLECISLELKNLARKEIPDESTSPLAAIEGMKLNTTQIMGTLERLTNTLRDLKLNY